jgi:hypothetical protein
MRFCELAKSFANLTDFANEQKMSQEQALIECEALHSSQFLLA